MASLVTWLQDRLAETGAGPERRYPVDALAQAVGINPGSATLTAQLVLLLGKDRGWVNRCRRLGLSQQQAEEWADTLGVDAAQVWPGPEWFLWGAARRNATRERCPAGHSYDRIINGRRRCTVCDRDTRKRHREKLKTLVRGVIPARRAHARHPQITLLAVTAQDSTPVDQETWLTVQEVADRLRIASRTVYEACARGDIQHVRVGRVIRIHPSALGTAGQS